MIQRQPADRCPDRRVVPTGLARPLLGLAAGTFLLLTGCSTNITDRDISEVALARAYELGRQGERNRGDVLMLDTRSEQVFSLGHIPGARNLRLGDLSDEREVESLRGYDTLVVYGRNPGDAAAKAVAKTLLAEKKLGKVYLFPGGIDAWHAAGYELATGTP